MSNTLHDIQVQAGAEFVVFGPAPTGRDREGAEASTPADPAGVELVLGFGAYEAEYAAIRKGAGLMHLPQRGLLRLTGRDRQDFLHRMTTQDIRGLTGGRTCRALQLNEKGRIVADLIVHHGDLDTWLEADAYDLPALTGLYEKRIFSEDLVLENISAARVMLAVHGTQTPDLPRALGGDAAVKPTEMPGTHHAIELAGQAVTAYRWDDCGSMGVRLAVPAAGAAGVYQALAEALGGLDPQVEGGVHRAITGRGIGWLAYNTARIEAGTPLFHVDFGPDSLPAEAGALDQAVSFTKGCYLGQEIVGRMKSQGHPKRLVVGLRCPDARLPIAGAEILDQGQAVGAVTSSAVSPLRGHTAIALAMVKWGKHKPGTILQVAAEGQIIAATVHALDEKLP
jgi:folate-binding protein YgfZ